MVENDANEPAGRKSTRRRRVPGGRQTKHIVRVTPEEEGQLMSRALRYGVSVPKLLVDSALAGDASTAAENASVRDALITELFGVHRLLANIANNVNQIARVANSTKQDIPAETNATLAAARRTADRIDALVDQLSEALR